MPKKIVTIASIMAVIGTTAFAAPSVRNASLNTNQNAGGTTARAGTLRTTPARATAKNTESPAQIISNAISSTSTERIPVVSTKKVKIPNKTNTITSTDTIEARIDKVQAAIDAERDTSAKKDEVYTKEQIDELLGQMSNKIPKVDDRGNINFVDPNGNLIVVHTGDLVIGGDDIIVVDGTLSTTSTNPIQNQAVTNALNEKQNKSTNLSFGNQNGGWTHVANSSDYIELYTNPANAKGFRIKPDMIATDLDNAPTGALVTADAVQNALSAITNNPGSGQQGTYFNLINLETWHGGLVQEYTYETNAQASEILEFALTACGGSFSDKWCTLLESDGTTFKIIRRQQGHNAEDFTAAIYDNGPRIMYAVNPPDGMSPNTYATEYLCANRSNTCHMVDAFYTGSNGYNPNEASDPIYFIDIELSNEH